MTEILRSIHSGLFWFLVFFYSVTINAVSYVIALFIRSEEKKHLIFLKGTKLWGTLSINATLAKVKVTGLENIPDDSNVIFTPNHQSYLDIFVLLKYLPQPFTFIAMRKLFTVPVIGNYMKRAGFLSLDRKDRKNAVRTIHTITDRLKEGRSFVIFPEGKLTTDGKIGEFGRGTAIIIQRSGKPVIPIRIDGGFSVLPKGEWKLTPQEIKVSIGKPVYFDGDYAEVKKETSMIVSDKLRDILIGLKG